MIIAEERNQLFTLFDNPNESSLPYGFSQDEGGTYINNKHVFVSLSLKSRFNPDLRFYVVHCDYFIRRGMDADDIFDIIKERYEESGHRLLDELYTCIERI